MKLLKGKQQVKPTSIRVDIRHTVVDYNTYDTATTPLLDKEGNRFFFVDNPLTRTERNTHHLSIDGDNYTHYRSILEGSAKWLKENNSTLTARFSKVDLPIEDVINKVSLKGLYRMCPTQIDNILDSPSSVIKQDEHKERQFIKKRDIYDGVTPYAFKNAVVGYYQGSPYLQEQYKLLEQKIKEAEKMEGYPDEWYPIDVRCTRSVKAGDNVIRPKLNERYIHTYDGDSHYLNLCASLIAGLKTVPVEVNYLGGCEKNAVGIWSPNAILNMYARHLVEAQEQGV